MCLQEPGHLQWLLPHFGPLVACGPRGLPIGTVPIRLFQPQQPRRKVATWIKVFRGYSGDTLLVSLLPRTPALPGTKHTPEGLFQLLDQSLAAQRATGPLVTAQPLLLLRIDPGRKQTCPVVDHLPKRRVAKQRIGPTFQVCPATTVADIDGPFAPCGLEPD